jgi:hypothetical protein
MRKLLGVDRDREETGAEGWPGFFVKTNSRR